MNLIYISGYQHQIESNRLTFTKMMSFSYQLEQFAKDNDLHLKIFKPNYKDLNELKSSIEEMKQYIEENDEIVLIGNSMGGSVSLNLALHFNIKLILINPQLNPTISTSLLNQEDKDVLPFLNSLVEESKPILDNLSSPIISLCLLGLLDEVVNPNHYIQNYSQYTKTTILDCQNAHRFFDFYFYNKAFLKAITYNKIFRKTK
jgi:predicted esterase YcpF (UPF0227 family)